MERRPVTPQDEAPKPTLAPLKPIDAELECLIRARYPLVYVISSEEQRVETSLMQIAARRGPKVYVWSITEGFVGPTEKHADSKDPLRALQFILESKDRAIFVLRDFHPYMKDPAVVRRLRDLNRALKNAPKNVFLVSPVMFLPAELDKEIAVLNYPLPELKDLEHSLDKIIASVAGTGRAIELPAKEKERVVEAALGLTVEEAEGVFSKSLVQTGALDLNVILGEKERIVRKSGILEFFRTSTDIGDIGGLDQLKGWLAKRQAAFTHEARDFGLPRPKGVLLLGIPGCGKSLTAKAVGSFWRLPLLRLDVGKVFAGIVGSSEENMRRAIAMAEAVAPSILWLDELEKGLSGSGSSNMSDGGTAARVFGSFVSWLQEKTSPVFVIATANDVTQLPPELMRKGRFDEIFFVDLPTLPERREIVNIHIRKRKRDVAKFDVEKIAQASEGMSGAELEQAVISAMFDAFDEKREVDTLDIFKSIGETVPLSTTMKEDIAHLRDWCRTRARPASSAYAEQQATGRMLEMADNKPPPAAGS